MAPRLYKFNRSHHFTGEMVRFNSSLLGYQSKKFFLFIKQYIYLFIYLFIYVHLPLIFRTRLIKAGRCK